MHALTHGSDGLRCDSHTVRWSLLPGNGSNNEHLASAQVCRRTCFWSLCAQFNQQLGHGAFKAVFKGYDEEEGIEVAWCQVNMERVGEAETTQIHQEVGILKSLTHKVCKTPDTRSLQ